MSHSIPHNMVLTGFMGTGKTSVGREVAQRLGWPLVDMDEVIESRAGMSIPEIFERQGETVFREMEAALCRELAERPQVVISTGGGALVSDENYEALAAQGMVVCLHCDLEIMWERLARSTHRPMLYAADRRARIEQLYAQREPAYARIPLQVDTGSADIETAATEILRYWGAVETQIPVQAPGGDYVIHLARSGIQRVGDWWRTLANGSTIGLVSNETVGPLYAESVAKPLRRAGFQVHAWFLPDGEIHKTLKMVSGLYDHFVEAGLARDSSVWALGGGVIGDTVGLAAATYMRGVQLVQIPTSLLAMVDSSVGGKVAVDHPAGKNLIGAFKQPALVVADPDLLGTLPLTQYRSGLAEIIKAGVIDDPALFRYFERGGSGAIGWPIAEAIRFKARIVAEDPFEQGRRATLNLGHTFGHALELLSDYALPHGHAVSIGMVVAAQVAVSAGLAEIDLVQRLVTCLERHGLPTQLPPYNPADIWSAMGHDKKKRGNKLRFILPRSIGDVIVTQDIERDMVLRTLTQMGSAEETK